MAKNVRNMLNAYNEYKNSFNAAIRFIVETSKNEKVEIPAAPAKDNDSDEAKMLRKEIKSKKEYNELIIDCKEIVTKFAVEEKGLKGAAVKELRNRIVAKFPYVDANGKAVKFVKLPSYLKSEVKEYDNCYAVVAATWIEAICAAADNENDTREEYEQTISPIVVGGELISGAKGELVDKKGYVHTDETTQSIFTTWESEAVIENIAGAAGREKKKETKSELKKK